MIYYTIRAKYGQLKNHLDIAYKSFNKYLYFVSGRDRKDTETKKEKFDRRWITAYSLDLMVAFWLHGQTDRDRPLIEK